MKILKIKLSLILLAHIALVGCNTNEEEPTPVVFPELIENSINQIELNPQDSISINFTNEFRGFSEFYWVSGVSYEVSLKLISLEGLDIDTLWENNRTLKIWTKELLPTSQSLVLNVTIEWSNDETNSEVNEEFNIQTSSEVLSLDNIISTYPLDRQYYFLQNEYSKGFFHIARFPTDISSLSVLILDKEQNIIHSTTLTKNQLNMRLDFDLPNLVNEELYQLELIDGEEAIYHLDFRTSSFNSFKDKIANLELVSTFRGLHIPFSQHFLMQNAQITPEGFDKSEASSAIEQIEGNEYRYSNGLVRLEFNPAGNLWYEDYLYPLIYAPFSDSSFEPKYANHPNLGVIPLLAMNLEFTEELLELTDEEIVDGTASQSSQLEFKVFNYVQSAAAWDLFALQSSAVQRYINDATFPERINDLIWGHYQVLTTGTYKYDMNYKLPDGTISSTRTFEMVYE